MVRESQNENCMVNDLFDIHEFMSPIDKYFKKWDEELKEELVANEETVKEILKYFVTCKRIFISGEGRSGLIGKFSGNRLMHTGIDVFYVQDGLAPAITEEDLLLAISGSGETSSVVIHAMNAKKIGAKVVAITAREDSTLTKYCDCALVLRGRTKDDKSYNDVTLKDNPPITYMGTQFEYKALCTLEMFANARAKFYGMKEEDMKRRHQNI